MDFIKKLYKDNYLSNCIFKFPDNRELTANKTILSFYSPVFNSMFFGSLSESHEEIPTVEIVDVDYEIFDKLLL